MRILLPWDLQPATAHALAVGADYARRLQAELYVLHVSAPDPSFVGYEAGPDVVRDQVAHELRAEHRQLQQAAAGLRDQGLAVTALCVQGASAGQILREAERLQTELIIMASHGRGAALDLLLGSVSREVVKHSQWPVMLVPAPAHSIRG